MAIPLHKRRKVADFDPVRDGKTVTQFCKELGISRQTYTNIKNRVAQKGRSGILPDSTAPKNPARKFDETDKIAVVNARQHLMEQGLDYGPWSIYYYLFDSVGPDCTPSRSTIALWHHELGFVDANARKRPRSSYKRFARDFVGELWQIDGLVYRLFDHAHTQEAATSPEASTDDMAAQQGLPPIDTPTLTMPTTQSTNSWGIPDELRVSKDGVVRVCGHGLYIGLRFKHRLLFTTVTENNVAEFYTAHDGEFLFSVPLPIALSHRPPGGQININLVKGMKHRQPPQLKPNLSKPRPKRKPHR